MNKTKLYQDQSRLLARTIVLAASLIGTHFLLFLLFFLGVKPYLTPLMQTNEYAQYAYYIYIVLWFLVPFFVYRHAILKKQYHIILYMYLEKKRNEKIAKFNQKRNEIRQSIVTLTDEIKQAYHVGTIEVNEEYVFILEILGGMQKAALKEQGYAVPIVTINGNAVTVKAKDKNHILCYARSAVFATDRNIVFNLGENNYSCPNPFFVDFNCQKEILWQCEGHADERKIFIPIAYFPNALPHIPYWFALKMHKTEFGNFSGKVDATGKFLVVQLSKDIHRKDCDSNKIASLSVTWGKKEKIILPQPTVLVRDGKELMEF